MRKFSLIYISVFLTQMVFSQIYIPLDTANLSVRKDKSKIYLENSKLFIAKIKEEFSGKEKSYIKEKFEKSQKNFNEELLHGDYIFDTRFDNLVDSIVGALRAHNPIIPNNLTFYISKNLSLNAASMGDNTFVINLGTFYYLDNEHQLASLISHEIGHYILKHQIETFKRHLKFEKTDAKKQLSEVMNVKYNRGTKALERYKAILYTDGSLNKNQECSADSIGYVLYKNSKYNKADYLNAFKLMAEYDSIKPKGLELETYRKIFDLPKQHFKEEWLKREDFSSYDYSKYHSRFNKDSLKSHPETEERIARLKKLFPELSKPADTTKPSSGFLKLQHIAEFEQAPNLDFNEDYGGGVYLSLLQIQRDSNSQYHKEWLGRFFQKIYDARKAYTLNRYLDRIDPKEQSDSYQQFINFMWNLNVNELKTIADYYTKKGF